MKQVDFSPLRQSLARCRSEGLRVPIWWRDDDATAPSPALDRLLSLAEARGVPVHLAVIPQAATGALASALQDRPAHAMVHGWAHTDHSPAGAKKAEFGQPRALALQETTNALSRLTDLFGARLLPVFVPPWNRIAPEIAAALPAQGYRALSTFGPRSDPQWQVNTHIDPIWWKGTRDLVPPDTLVAQTAALLDDRLAGKTDTSEPLGLLTHHLVHTPAIWAFTEAWLTEMLAGGAEVIHTITGDIS